MSSIEYWEINDEVNDDKKRKIVEETAKTVDSVSVNPTFGQYAGNSALTVARTPARIGSYFADIPNLLAEGTAYTKHKLGKLDQSKYGDAGYQGFGTAIPSLLKQDDANPFLNILQPHGANLRESNPLALFDDKEKINYGDPNSWLSPLLPDEKTLTFATDFALFDKFGMNKIPKVLGGKSGYNNPFGGVQSAQAVRSALLGGGAYNLGAFDSLTGIGATIVTDLVSRRMLTKSQSNLKDYLGEVLGGKGLSKEQISSWSRVARQTVDLDTAYLEWTGKGRSVADMVQDPRIGKIITLLESTPQGMQILGTWFRQRGLQFDKTVQERFGKYIDNAKNTDAQILGGELIANLGKHYKDTNKSWRDTINSGNTPLNSKVGIQFKDDLTMLHKTFESNQNKYAVNNHKFINDTVLKNLFVIKKEPIKKPNGKYVRDSSGNITKKTTYTLKDFDSIDDLITRRNEIHAQFNKSTTDPSGLVYGADAKDFLKQLDEIIANNVDEFGTAQSNKDLAVKQFNKLNANTTDIFKAWGEIGSKGGSTGLSGQKLISDTLKFMESNPSYKSVSTFIKLLDKTGNGKVIDKLMPYYVKGKIEKVVKSGKKGEVNASNIYKALTENTAGYDNLSRWFSAINKNRNLNNKIDHKSFQKSLDEFTAISETMFKPVTNSVTAINLNFMDRMRQSIGVNLAKIFKLEADLGLVKNLEDFNYLTQTRILSETIVSPNGLEMINTLSKNVPIEQKRRIVETIIKVNLLGYEQTLEKKKDVVETKEADAQLRDNLKSSIDMWELVE